MQKTLAIVGGGAAGMSAAIFAARALQGSAQILLFERCDRVGKKLLATGNGRCNLSNTSVSEDDYVSDDIPAVKNILRRFDVPSTLSFFELLGIVPKIETDGRVYPLSGQASAVLDVLRDECARLGVSELTNCEVNRIMPQTGGFILKANDRNIPAQAVIVAAGGQASPNLGSNGSGYALMQQLGHSCTPLSSALVQIKTDIAPIRSLQGLKFTGNATLLDGETRIAASAGEVLFCEYGVSGPPIFQLSIACAQVWRKNPGHLLTLELDLLSGYDEKELRCLLQTRASLLSEKPLSSFFTGLLNKRIGLAVLKMSGLNALTRPNSSLQEADLCALAYACKHFRLQARANMPFDKAQATAGGIPLCEFTSELESNLVSGLFAAGEILDVLGSCGGYNLQWAWSSAFVSANAATGFLNRLG